MRLREAQHERIFESAAGLERFAKSAEDLLVLVAVFLTEHHQSRGRKSVRQAVEAAAVADN
jgi:hypothetical protein